MKVRSIVYFFSWFILSCSISSAETLISKNGKTIEGRLLQETKDYFVMEISGVGQLTVSKQEVASITRGSASPVPVPVSAATQVSLPLKKLPLAKQHATIVGKPWILIHQSSDERSAVAQYVPKGKTLENSQELITAEFFTGVPTDADSLQRGVAQTQMVFQKRCPSMDFRIVSQSAQEILYEWRIGECEGASNQSEIVKVGATETGLAVIHYAAKQADLSDVVRRKWRDWLGKPGALEALVDTTANKV